MSDNNTPNRPDAKRSEYYEVEPESKTARDKVGSAISMASGSALIGTAFGTVAAVIAGAFIGIAISGLINHFEGTSSKEADND